jgi:glutathionylspermidine synthase
VERIGYDHGARAFVDEADRPIEALFKLYPWEWLAHEDFGRFLPDEPCRMIEPAWKMLLSNKAILAVAWETFPGHPNLLPTYLEPRPIYVTGQNYVRKPFLSREGSNVSILEATGETLEARGGDYGEEGFVYQQYVELPSFETAGGARHPVLGSWIVGGDPAGLGVREGETRITDNQSRFVPHFVGEL